MSRRSRVVPRLKQWAHLTGRIDEVQAGVGRIEELVVSIVTGEHPRRNRAADAALQKLLRMRYQQLAHEGRTVPLRDTEMKFFSQNGEDGILLYLFSLINPVTRRAVEICAGDGIECNTANLVVNHGWQALMVDGGDPISSRGRRFYTEGLDTWFWPPTLVQSWIAAETVNELIVSNGFGGSIDLLSLDMDGVDYWVWQAMDCVEPQVVVAEVNPGLGGEVSLAVPYDRSFDLAARTAAGGHPWHFGASLQAYTKLARSKGLRLVGVQQFNFNAFFVRDGLAEDLLPEVDPADCFTHPAALKGIEVFDKVRDDLEWIEI